MVVALGLFALAQTGGGGNGPLNAMAKAAETTQSEPGGHTAMHGTATKGTKTVTMSGTMVFDEDGHMRGEITTSKVGSRGPVKMEVMAGDGAVYMSSSQFGSLPEGSRWMKLEFPAGKNPEGSLATGDAEETLKLLERAGGVEEVGKEDVRGIATTRYRGIISSASKMGAEAWVDAQGRVRRMRLISSKAHAEADGTTIDMTLEYLNFTAVPEIAMPASNEVFDMTGMVSGATGSSSGG